MDTFVTFALLAGCGIFSLLYFVLQKRPIEQTPIREKYPEPFMPSIDTITEIPVTPSNAQKLYDTAFKCIGRDMSPKDLAPDSLACVESLRGVIKEAFGYDVAPGVLNTVGLDTALSKDTRFTPIEESDMSVGDIIVALSTNTTHGHCGIRGKTTYMSNDSSTGRWTANYNIPNWDLVFKGTLGLINHCYRVK